MGKYIFAESLQNICSTVKIIFRVKSMKWTGRLFVLIIFLVIGTCLYAYFSLQQLQPPSIDKAKWVVQAYIEQDGVKVPTRYYYTGNVKISGGSAIMTTYWAFDGEKYHKKTGGRKVLPPFKILRRNE